MSILVINHKQRRALAQRTVAVLGITVLFLLPAFAQTDPGPRNGAAAAGQSVAGLTSYQSAFFNDGLERFAETETVTKDGLGPRFNSNSCSSCHAYPAIGGSSPKVNPQATMANQYNELPPFISANGPVREARFVLNPNGTPDGGVHNLYTIMGQSDTPSACKLTQENFTNANNIGLRIPTPLYGLGLVEAVTEATLTNNLAANSSAKLLAGVSGRFNRSGNDGTITRFGWKAQNKSIQIFSGEAYLVEMGISNLLFPNERDDTPGCSPYPAMNDTMSFDTVEPSVFDDVTAFAGFIRFLAPPTPAPATALSARGQGLFNMIGCGLCHTPTLQTGNNAFAPLANQTISPYSDFALHHMGPGLADRISQGLAEGDEFRTAPLWGLGQRLFFLHDGRASDLVAAINAHASMGNPAFGPSEANKSVLLYDSLQPSDKQALLTFLRSL